MTLTKICFLFLILKYFSLEFKLELRVDFWFYSPFLRRDGAAGDRIDVRPRALEEFKSVIITLESDGRGDDGNVVY